MGNVNQKKCINVNFSEGLGIFDNHYGYPVIDQEEKYNGPTGKVADIKGIQARAGYYFITPDGKEGKEFSFDIDECPYFHIAIKAEKGTNTCLYLMVLDKEPREYIKRFVMIGKTPQGDPGTYNVINKPIEFEDDGQWHEYDLDLREIREKQDDKHPYYPDAGSVCIIQFYSSTGSGEHTFHFNDLLLTQESQPIITTFKGLVYVKHGRVGTRSEGPDYYLQTRIGDFRLCYEERNLWEPDYLLEYYCRRMVEVKGDIEEKMILNVKHINEICESLIPETHKIFKAKIVNSSSSEITDIRLGMIGADKNISIDSLAVGSSTEQYEFLLRNIKIKPISYGDYTGGYTQLGVKKLIFIPHPPGMITIEINDKSLSIE